MMYPRPSCLPLLMHAMPCAFNLALPSAGNSSAARMAMMAMTTSNSISVNARFLETWVEAIGFMIVVRAGAEQTRCSQGEAPAQVCVFMQVI